MLPKVTLKSLQGACLFQKCLNSVPAYHLIVLPCCQ